MGWKPITAVLLVSFGLRLAAGFWWQSRLPQGAKFGFPDSESYWMLAQTIAQGRPYQTNPDRRVFRTPGYPLLLAGLFRSAGGEPPVMWARGLSALLGTLAVAGVILLARVLFDERAALVAGVAAALYPGAISTSTFVLSEAPFCPFMVLDLVLWALAWKAVNPGRQAILGAAAGVLGGIATLMRPSWLLFVPFAIAVGLASRRDMGRHLWVGIWMVAGLVAAMMPWWVRNWCVTGGFVPTTLQVGESLYDGLNPRATGASDMAFVDQFRQQLRHEDVRRGAAATGQATFEQRLDRRMRDAALAWARKNPGRAVQLAAVKFGRMWNVWPNEPSLRHPLFCAVAAVGYVPLLAISLSGAWKCAGRGWPYVLCFLPAVYLTCLHMVFVGSIRYRQPAMLPLIALAAGFVVPWLWKRAEPALS